MIPCRSLVAAIVFSTFTAITRLSAAEAWVRASPHPGDFALVSGETAAALVCAPEDFKVVDLAVHDLAADVARVTDRSPALRSDLAGLHGSVVLIGTLGKNPLIDALATAGKLGDAAAVAKLRGAWESFIITTVEAPAPGIERALVIVGSDRRGTAYGVYELSQAIGVSPWHWWADLAPEKKTALYVAAGTHRFGPPSVKYRGIFINDEDWGLQPWAAKTFEPENGGIGVKTYAKVFELLLRLKANTLWPAMHACSPAFNRDPRRARLADDYGIVMGSSHAEPMLRNNVSEWSAPPETYNYATNRDGVLKYWDERVTTNAAFENIYTLGMRGIHDSGMQGPKAKTEQIALLEKIFADQRALLAQYVRPDVERVPQLFCAYKEVLELYRGGLHVPDDVTVMFPDDNFGFIRNFPSAEERGRAGGFGVYYHLSYLGRPLSYLWLATTPPALVWEEMSKAYDRGARQIWIANVGDIKPGEIGTEFFLQMAWDMGRWQRDNVTDFLGEWAMREFGAVQAPEIAAIMGEYYRLNFQRKPEHLQWWLPSEPVRPSALNAVEIAERLAAFAKLRERAEALREKIPVARRDALTELVYYPVVGSALANERFFEGERGNLAVARAADARLTEETRLFNERVADGKWHRILALEPADNDWRSMRIARWAPPKDAPAAASASEAATLVAAEKSGGAESVIALEAENFARKRDGTGAEAAAWRVIPGLGRSGDAVAVFPTTAASIASEKISATAPRLDYDVSFAAAGEFAVQIYLLPTHPMAGDTLRLAFALDDGSPQLVAYAVKDGGPEWARGVLDAARIATAKLTVAAPGKHVLHLYGVDPGVVIDKLVIDLGGLRPSYLGPKETAVVKGR